MTKHNNEVPKNFTVSLAIVDCVPVIIFSLSVAILSIRFNSLLFVLGSVLVIVAGLLKCLWKFIVAINHKNISFLFYQMRIVMPIGFLLMMSALIIDRRFLSFPMIIKQMTSFPSLLFYILGFLLMICMSVFAFKLDSNNVKNNWIEQGTNILGQLMFLLGILF